MLVTLTVTGPDAEGLGFLLHKHADRVQRFSLPVGEATVFYPEGGPDRTTAALLLEVDPVGLVRGRRRDGLSLADYVTDRPYAASSMLAVALGRVFNTALGGRCDARPELAASALPLEVRVPGRPARPSGRGDRVRGAELVRRLFEPLGWSVAARETPLGPKGWGDSPYLDVTLTGTLRVADALSHLYVLLPVLDDAKHYWVSPDEVDKLVRRGGGWLGAHPERGLVTSRYLGFRRSWVEDAAARLDALEDLPPIEVEPNTTVAQDAEVGEGEPTASDGGAERPPLLKQQRLATVMTALKELGARRVVDVGCGEGVYLRELVRDPAFTEVVASTCRRASWRSPRSAWGWIGCRTGSARSSPCGRGRSPTATTPWPASTPCCWWR